MKVHHTGDYTNGHTYERVVEVNEPADIEELNSEDFEWEVVWPDTGDGVLERVGSHYHAEVVEADNPEFVGKTWCWID